MILGVSETDTTKDFCLKKAFFHPMGFLRSTNGHDCANDSLTNF